MNSNNPPRVGGGGPVGPGKTALLDALGQLQGHGYEIAVGHNDT